MPRAYLPMTAECDPKSSLMSEAAACRYLGTDGKGIVALIKQGRLKRDTLTGSFAKEQVEKVHDEILANLLGTPKTENKAFRTEPRLG